MANGRVGAAAVLLPSGKGADGGGCDCAAELYDPSTGTFDSLPFPATVSLSTATLLRDGRVLIAGGGPQPSLAQIYDPVAGQFSTLPPMVEPHEAYSTATLLNMTRPDR